MSLVFKTARMIGVFVFLSALHAGCTVSRNPTDFLTLRSTLREGPYFKSQHVMKNRNFEAYHKVQVKLVDLKYLETDVDYDWSEIRQLRDFFQGQLETRLQEGYLVMDREAEPDSETMVIQPILTFLAPPQDHLKVDGRRYGTLVPMATGMAAFEAKLTDGRTGHLLAEIAEQQSDGGNAKAVAYDIYKRYANTEAVLSRWSGQMLAMLQSLTGKRSYHENFTGDPPGLLIQDLREIQQMHQLWREKELEGDLGALLAMCSDDVRWMPPDALPLRGKKAVHDRLAAEAPEVTSIMITDRQIQGSSSVAYLTSHYSRVYRPSGALISKTDTGENLWVLRKIPGAGWKVVINSWNQSRETGSQEKAYGPEPLLPAAGSTYGY